MMNDGPKIAGLPEQSLFEILDASPDGVLISSTDGRIVYANAELGRLFGYSALELVGQSVELLVPQARRQQHAQSRNGRPHHRRNHAMAQGMEISGRHRDGTEIAVEVRLGTTMTRAGLLTVAFVADVAEVRRNQAELKRLNAALSLVHDCNEALVRAEDEPALLKAITDRLAESDDYATVWVGFADDAAARVVRVVASAGAGATELVRIDDAARGRGSAGEAIRRQQAVAACPTGEPRTLALPFARREGVVGCLVLESHDPRAFAVDERRLLKELADDLAYGIAALRTREERARHEAQLLYHNLYDALTGLPNRRLMSTRIDEAMRSARQATGVLLLGLDRFAPVNEAYGHAVGDRLIEEVANRLRKAVRRGDCVGRLSGDEFAILLTELSDAADAAQVADKLREALAEPFRVTDEEVVLSATVGAAISPQDGADSATLIARAEAAMMSAKESGRNSFACYRASGAAGQWRLSIGNELRHALEADEFRLHFQPVVALDSGRVVGCEALLRWQHPVRGTVPPAHFIPVAEDNGLIVPIGRWVIAAACRQAARWHAGGHPLTMAVNVSARQLHDGRLEQDIAAALASTGLPAAALVLEITESVLLGDLDATLGIINRLRETGIRFALDDFGTGYSSLQYLKHLPISTLKIDRAFVRDITTDRNDAAIVAATIAMAHVMELQVVAEGVETLDQLSYLRGRGCDEMQGYWFSPPVDAEAFDALLTGAGRRGEIAAQAPGLLVVDDEPAIGSAIKRLLRRENYPIHLAPSGAAGLEILKSERIGVIISDQRMPGMSGSEFLVRAREICPRTVRVVLSGYADLDAMARVVNEGAIFRYLSKPWDDDELRQTIQAAFAAYSAA
jgi:diguanylate cyclase (GGDEF)-like protein/PAS domain S-box-containing protein